MENTHLITSPKAIIVLLKILTDLILKKKTLKYTVASLLKL